MNPVLPADYLVILAVLGLAGSAFVAWRGVRSLGLPGRLAVTGLRLAALSLLLLIALNPGRWESPREEEEGRWALLLDASASTEVADWGERPRTEAVGDAAGILVREARRTGVGLDAFDYAGDLRRLEDPATLTPRDSGEGTRLGRSLRSLLQHDGGQDPLAGIVVVGDGREIPPAPPDDVLLAARARGIPVHVLPVGGAIVPPDLAVEATPRRVTAFANQNLTLRARVSSTGLEPLQTVVELRDTSGHTVGEESLRLPDDATADITFDLEPLPPGYHEFSLHLPERPDENDPTNNSTPVGVVVLEGSLNVLLVEGSPHWDTKFIVQLLREMPFVHLTTVHRVTGERYFRVDPGEARPAQSQQAVFPDTLEELLGYDLVIFGRGVEYFVTPEKASHVRRFVSEHGGALVFTRGQPWENDQSGLGALMPYELGPIIRSEVRWQPTLAGEQEGFFGHGLPSWRDPIWERLPPLEGVRESLRPAPFTQTLVEGRVVGTSRTAPLLVSRRVGRGLVTAVNAEGLWKWDFFPEFEEAKRVYRDFWIQLFQWAATYAEFLPGQEFAIRLDEAEVDPGTPVRVFVSRRRTGGDVSAGEEPVVTIRRGDDFRQKLLPGAVPDQPDRWQAFFSLDDPGFYRINVRSADQPPDAVGASRGLLVRSPPLESDNLSADPAYLETLASATGGRVWTMDTLAEVFEETARSASARETNPRWIPRWDTVPLLLLILLCFAAEWWYRRRRGLS